MSYPLLCLWAFCLFASFVGWGWLLSRRSSWALAGALGAALLVGLNAYLSYFHFVTRPVLIALVLFGDASALLLARSPKESVSGVGASRGKGRSVAFACLVLLLAIEVFGNFRLDPRAFNHNDDLPAYLTLPVETLQLGTLPTDPFNERRVTSSLGAPYVLQSAVLAGGADVRSIRIIDVSIGFLLYAGMVWAIGAQTGLTQTGAYLLALGIFVVPIFRLNSTAAILPAALFCALFTVQQKNGLADLFDARRAFFLALLAVALTALKSNYLPPALLICALFYAGSFLVRRRPAALVEGLLFGVMFAVLLLPWMLDMKAKEGTYLFPLLGRGYDASAYGMLPMPNGSHSISSGNLWVWLTATPMAGPLLIASAIASAVHRRHREEESALILGLFLLASAISIVGIASSTGGESIGRYSLPFQVPALLMFAAFAWQRRRAWAVGLAMASLLFLALLFGIHHDQYRLYLEDAGLLTPPGENWFDMPLEERRVRALQAAVPRGEHIFARLRVTYPFDFARNTIFVGDYLGMAGLPPGMPVDRGPEALRQYFASCGIHFVAFDPKRTLLADDDPKTTVHDFLQNPGRYGRHGWLYMQVKVSNAERATLAQLGELCPRVYDDGVVYVMDLRKVNRPTVQARYMVQAR